MPLAFESISHGRIAFGFFNIESDLLLLENHFFFLSDFCTYIVSLAREDDTFENGSFPGMLIDQKEKIGDLMGAIQGLRYTGFIGALYQHYPFPADRADFKQKTKGKATREMVEALISKFGHDAKISFFYNKKNDEVTIGVYRFNRSGFQELIDYVWRGGMPLWEDNEPPLQVMRMKRAATQSGHPLFKGMVFTNGS